MKVSFKDYKTLKTKTYFKSDFFAFFNEVPKNSTESSKTEQELKKKKLIHYRVFNKTAKTLIEQSVYKTTNFLFTGLTFLLKPVDTLNLNSLTQLHSFQLLAVKINKNIFSSDQIKQLYSSDYYSNALLLYQFNLTNIKTDFKGPASLSK